MIELQEQKTWTQGIQKRVEKVIQGMETEMAQHENIFSYEDLITRLREEFKSVRVLYLGIPAVVIDKCMILFNLEFRDTVDGELYLIKANFRIDDTCAGLFKEQQ